ncbi:MAG TPA: biotin--protein ligase [Thermomicrobiales bacterium]|nr:biotin--protein ligase [Thermomicrobiales bacterium]
MHGEYKTPGGKLVVVDFEVVDGRLTQVMMSGDFFLYPEEALEPMVGALDGLAVDVAEGGIARAVAAAIPEGAELFGFSPEAIEIALRRGLA